MEIRFIISIILCLSILSCEFYYNGSAEDCLKEGEYNSIKINTCDSSFAFMLSEEEDVFTLSSVCSGHNKEFILFKDNCNLVIKQKVTADSVKVIVFSSEGNIFRIYWENPVKDVLIGPNIYYHNNGIIDKYNWMNGTKDNTSSLFISFDSTGKILESEGILIVERNTMNDNDQKPLTVNLKLATIPYFNYIIDIDEINSDSTVVNAKHFTGNTLSYSMFDKQNDILVNIKAVNIIDNNSLFRQQLFLDNERNDKLSLSN